MAILEGWFVAWRQKAKTANRRKSPAKPGWYYDPRKQARYRYWDGSHWTDETTERLRPSPPPPPSDG